MSQIMCAPCTGGVARYPSSLLDRLQASCVAFVRACAAVMPRGSQRARPATTTLFKTCGAALGCSRREGSGSGGGGGGPEAAEGGRSGRGGGGSGPCRDAGRSLRQFKRSIDLLNEVGGGRPL
jgi:hypothetical protein